jgi:hypothetical protein
MTDPSTIVPLQTSLNPFIEADSTKQTSVDADRKQGSKIRTTVLWLNQIIRDWEENVVKMMKTKLVPQEGPTNKNLVVVIGKVVLTS